MAPAIDLGLRPFQEFASGDKAVKTPLSEVLINKSGLSQGTFYIGAITDNKKYALHCAKDGLMFYNGSTQSDIWNMYFSETSVGGLSIRKFGPICQIIGTYNIKGNETTANGGKKIATIPSGFIPRFGGWGITSGSSPVFAVNGSGNLVVHNVMGTSASEKNWTTGTTIYLSVVYMIF